MSLNPAFISWLNDSANAAMLDCLASYFAECEARAVQNLRSNHGKVDDLNRGAADTFREASQFKKRLTARYDASTKQNQ